MTGYEGDELVGRHVSTVMREQDVETAKRLIEELLKSDERRNATFEMQAVTEDGARFPCEDHIALLPSEEGFRGTAGVVRDITDRKEREQRLRRQNERLDQFAGVVSHDLRNPLNVILSRLELARRTGDTAHFDAIEHAGNRMERLIEDLLTLARDGQTVGEVEPVALERAAETAWQNVETNEATLSCDGGADRFLADSDRLASLLENLFRNAVEHGSTSPRSQAPEDAVEHGGTNVEIRVGTIDCTEDTGFYVADDGPGIPPEERDDVFEHGYSNSQNGTGLGLVIVDGIVDAHDWSITVTESEMGGARFEITDIDLQGQ